MNIRDNARFILILSATAASLCACAESIQPTACDRNDQCKDNEICTCEKEPCTDMKGSNPKYCTLNYCKDGILNHAESDVDCGAVCSTKCDIDKMCNANEDCKSGYCFAGLCANPEGQCENAAAGEIILSEILNNVNNGKLFENTGDVQSEFFEIVNRSGKKIALSPIEIQCLRTDDGSNKVTSFALSGCLDAKNVLVVSNTPIAMPRGGVNDVSLAGANQLTNTAAYTCSLIQKTVDAEGHSTTTPLHSVSIMADVPAGQSEILDPLVWKDVATSLVLHKDVNGRSHSPGYCTNGALFINDCDTMCSNGVIDEGETDVDCGGSLCGPCADDKACLMNSDCIDQRCIENHCLHTSCVTLTCVDGVCDPVSGDCHSCSDGVKNGDETDIDCGGAGCPACKKTQACLTNDDCETNLCEHNVCTGEVVVCEAPQPGDLIITEFFNNAKAGAEMSMHEPASGQTQVEFIELLNLSGKPLNLKGLSIHVDRLDNPAKPQPDIELKDCLPAGQAAVITSAPIAGLPVDAVNILAASSFAETNAFTNTATLQLTLMAGQTVLHTVHEMSAPATGKSRVLEIDDYSPADTELVDHTAINERLSHSPGYCTNGGLYSENCEVKCANAKLDGNETDLDCGGSCDPCDLGKSCLVDTDCISQNCRDGRCDIEKCTSDSACPDGVCDEITGICSTCSDNIQNGNESAVDCGGNHCAQCEAGKTCQTDSDCLSFECTNRVCTGDPVNIAKSSDLIINEIMGAPLKGAKFSTQPDDIQCEFVEIVSRAADRRNLSGWMLNFRKSGAATAPTSIPLMGLLEPKHGIVVNNCSTLALPDDMRSQTMNNDLITNSAEYDFWLENNDTHEKTDVVIRHGLKSANGQSQTRSPELDPDAELIFHKTANPKLLNSPGYCANGGLFSEDCLTVCSNETLDEGETDIDCGGPACLPCSLGKICQDDADCASEYCSDNQCAVRPCASAKDCDANSVCLEGTCYSCEDKVQNGDETDVDCGGSCTAKCENTKKCRVNSDCVTGECVSNICSGSEAVAAEPNDLVINEFMAASDSNNKFTLNNDGKQCKFVEAVNVSGHKISLDNCTIVLERTDVENKTNTTKLSGNLMDKSALVAADTATCTDLALPDGTLKFKLTTTNVSQDGTFKLYVKCGEETGTELTSAKATKGTSMNLTPELNVSTPGMVLHTSVPNAIANASPGYCVNGGLFADDCKTHCENTLQDADETALNCGGKLCSPCENGKTCKVNSDCQSGECSGNVCTGEAAQAVKPSDLVINEVLTALKSSYTFLYNKDGNGAPAAECEFVEIVNISGHKVNLDGAIFNRYQEAEGKTPSSKTASLSGTLDKNQAIVLHNCASLPLPDDAVSGTLGSSFFTDNMTYKLWISVGTEEGAVITNLKQAGAGESMVRELDMSPTATMVGHHARYSGEGVHASPGYCVNGKTFTQGCD